MMGHLVAAALCVAGFVALAFSTLRQQRDLVGRALPLAATSMFRAAGAGALIAALGLLIARHGWDHGLVMFSGHSSLAAGIAYCALIAYARIHHRSLPHR
ncbi:DUF3325 family protein [Rhodopseudomonas palustris]|uniref:DUF3325 domain-containing protein n=1 Tax=Rhodopseudomonas palustris (strain BisB18) TaxID=316056 RepID=Q213N3_RHOPB